MAKKKTKTEHGGRRSGSGKPAWFRGKSVGKDTSNPLYTSVAKAITLRLTAKGWEPIESKIAEFERTKNDDEPSVSYSDFIETLSRIYGPRVTLADVRRLSKMG